MNTKRLGQLILAAALTFVATPAAAGPVHEALTGGLVDPHATNLRVVPPKGGMVMVYRDGKAVAWFMRAGYAQLAPNHIYGIVATKGQSMLFNARVIMRPGLTQMVWEGKNRAPAINYAPAYYGPSYDGHHHARPDRAHARPPASHPAHHGRQRISASEQRRLVRKLAALPSDKQRLAVVRSYAGKYTFSAAQARAVVKEMDGRSYRTSAERALGLKSASTPSRAKAAPRAGLQRL